MRKTSLAALFAATSIAALLTASSAFAAQNVANTSQKGSLLIFPLINVVHSGTGATAEAWDTIVEISNDQNSSIHVECEYVNEEKGRVNFDFELTAKQTVSWDVWTLAGDHVNPPPFPTGPGNPSFNGNPQRGELVCFATDDGRQFQVAFNELIGSATVLNYNDADAIQHKQAFKYNAWAFAARCAPGGSCPSTGLAPDNNTVAQGTPGDLVLSGANAAGAYDACPSYNIANFMPNGSALGNIDTLDNWLSVASCNQDLRETYVLHLTKLDFTVWNSNEVSFTGAYACVDSVETIPLGSPQPNPPIVVDATNFDYATVRTPNARLQVQGISATPPCPFPTQATGLVAVLSSSNSIFPDTGEDQETGNTTQGAGVEAGFVLWDPAGSVPATNKKP
ncbi:MAG: hypothetical protein JO288_22395 [Hyphomicrobiales bacterium]|nr:hypothetical protein [Hyphomicrobiales bacterium]